MLIFSLSLAGDLLVYQLLIQHTTRKATGERLLIRKSKQII